MTTMGIPLLYKNILQSMGGLQLLRIIQYKVGYILKSIKIILKLKFHRSIKLYTSADCRPLDKYWLFCTGHNGKN